MGKQKMFGVVLWVDAAACKAVIWCEDQGELAYYMPTRDRSEHNPNLTAGDLIGFDMELEDNVRKAHKPILLKAAHSPDLPDALRAEGSGEGQDTCPPSESDQTPNKIVPLSNYSGAQKSGKLASSG